MDLEARKISFMFVMVDEARIPWSFKCAGVSLSVMSTFAMDEMILKLRVALRVFANSCYWE
jgi:hypothetical protein